MNDDISNVSGLLIHFLHIMSFLKYLMESIVNNNAGFRVGPIG